MRCHTCVEKDDRSEPITVIQSPVGMHQPWRRGYRVKSVNVTGDKRYRRPYPIALDYIDLMTCVWCLYDTVDVVPTVARSPLLPCKASCVL